MSDTYRRYVVYLGVCALRDWLKRLHRQVGFRVTD